jgi:hypothetical protein
VPPLPPPTIVAHALLGPLVPAVDPEGIGAVAATPGTKLTHYRVDRAGAVRDCLEIVPPAGAAVWHIPGDTLYAGPFFEHFGHMLAE